MRKTKRPRRGVRQKSRGPSGFFEIDIVELGHRGDGVGQVDGRDVFIPYSLPGDQVKSRLSNGRGEIVELLKASPMRRKPVCQYFGRCGGCDLQHMNAQDYLNWKQEQVRKALHQRDIRDVSIEPVIEISPGTRRRVTFTARRKNSTFVFGFHERAQHQLLEIQDCPLLTSALRAAVPSFKALSEALLLDEGRLTLLVTEAHNGFDLYAHHDDGSAVMFGYEQREDIAAMARDLGCARLTVNDDLLLSFEEPQIAIGDFSSPLPPGGFLQATQYSERQLQALVLRAVSGAESVADLFCGSGTFSLPLAKSTRVLAIDSSENATAALSGMVQGEPDLAKIKTECRDLFEEPILANELNEFEAVIFDPPRKGALAQAREIAKSHVTKVAAVSCDPGTFARDAKILMDGGYRLDWVAPVDQFLWSHHIEMVAAFYRD